MSDSGGGGGGIGIVVGAAVGGCVVVVVVIAVIIYCFMKSRQQRKDTQMTKATGVFTTPSNMNYPKTRGRVNMNPDPDAARRERREREKRDRANGGHVNPAFSRQGSDSSSVASNDRDISPPRVRRARGGHVNDAFSSESSFDDSSSYDEAGQVDASFKMESETKNSVFRSSYKQAKQNNLMDGDKSRDKANGYGSRGRRSNQDRTDSARVHQSRRANFDALTRNPRSDSPLTIETLQKHEKRTSKDEPPSDGIPRRISSTRRPNTKETRDRSPSKDDTSTVTSLVTEVTDHTHNTGSTMRRYEKNESLRRASPSRSSSHRRYKKENNTDSHGRKVPRRTPSGERKRQRRHSDRSSSPGGSSRSRRSMSSEDSKKVNRQQEMLPIFSTGKGKGGKHSAV